MKFSCYFRLFTTSTRQWRMQLQSWPSLDNFQLVTKPRGYVFHRQGSPPPHIYIVQQGIIKLCTIDQDGRESIILLQREGSVIGNEPFLLNEPALTTATAATPVMAHVLPQKAYATLLSTDHLFARFIVSAVTRQSFSIQHHHVQLLTLPAKERLLELLRSFSSYPGGVPLRAWELAQLIGITPWYLSRLVRDLTHCGLVARHDGRLVLGPEYHRIRSCALSGAVASLAHRSAAVPSVSSTSMVR